MSTITRLGFTLCLTAVFALSACGGTTGDVKAINLKSGETRNFSSEGEVPDGWATCPTPECDVLPPSVPCQNLSGEVCELNPECRVKVLSCQGSGTVVPGGVTPPSEPTDPPTEPTDPSQPGDPMPYPPEPTDPPEPGPTQTCEVVCLPKDTVLCQELQDENQCLANASCSWEMMCPVYQCEPGAECPAPPCVGQCLPKQPESCDALDEATCQARPDCNWLPQPCPLCPDLPPGTDGEVPAEFLCECPSFCQPAQQVCPPIAYPDPSYCPDGELTPDFDSNGCVVGYICAACPLLAAPMMDCEDGVLVEIYDDNGCVVGWECKPVTNNCEQLALQYQETLRAAKACNPLADSGPVNPCGKIVSDSLFCACVTFANAANTEAIAQLDSLEREAQNLGCYQNLACPAVACLVPQGASCAGATSGGPLPDGVPEPVPEGTCQDL